MKTVIMYINRSGYVSSDHERILECEIEKGQIVFLCFSVSHFQKEQAAVYRTISDQVKAHREWKLILVDDSRYECKSEREACPPDCGGGKRHHYNQYLFAEQLAVLCGEKADGDYTASVPETFFVILTRTGQKPCLYDMRVPGSADPCRIPAELPAHARYLIFDFPARGSYFREEKEWQLFFLLWILSRDEVPADCLQAERIYRVSVEWDTDKLAEYLYEMREQLQWLQEQTENFRISYAAPDAGLASRRTGKHRGNPLQINTPAANGRAFQQSGSLWYWERMLRGVGEQYEDLRGKRQDINREGEEGFRAIRRTNWIVPQGKDAERDYEKILIRNFREGNADYEEWEQELNRLYKELKEQVRQRPGIGGLFAELLVVFAVSGCLYQGQKFWPYILCMLLILSLALLLCDKELKTGMQLDLLIRLRNVQEKIEASVRKDEGRINSKFEAMKHYKGYVNWEKQRRQEEKSQRARQAENRTREGNLEEAAEFYDKLEKFSGKRSGKKELLQSAGMDEREALYYPARWKQEGHVCDIRGEKVACPYYFLQKIMLEVEQEVG